MKKMDSYKVFKGRSGVPSFSMRYNAEDEELEQLIEAPDSKDESEEGKESVMETPQDKKAATKDSPVTSKKSMKRSSSLDDQQPPHPPPPPGETWKFLTDIKGRITKTVEEKIEEIKSDRMKKKKKKNKLITGGENSSISDSEEKSSEAASVSQVSQVLSSSGGGIGIAGGEGSSDDDNDDDEDDVTEKDVSDSTPEQLSTAHKRGSIEVAEEALEEEDGLGVVGEIEGSPKRKGPFAKGNNSKTHNLSMMAEFSERNMWLLRWSLVLPIVLALLFFYIPFSSIPSQLVWACVGGAVVLGLSWLKQRFWSFSNYSSQRQKDDNSGLYFTGSFHVNSFHILPDQIRQLPSSADPQTILHQGWLNEYEEEYSDDRYRLRDTQCVWVSLRGSRLTLSIPQRSPPRRAFWSEPHHPKIFTRHRIYNLANCRVSLLPDGLTSKRLWSKKYPIYIKLDADSYIGSTYREPHDKDQINKTTYSSLIDADFASEAFDEEKKEFNSTIKEFTKKNEDGEALSDSNTQDDNAGRGSEKMKGTSNDDDLEYTDFVHVSPSLIEKKIFLCLFARSDREKEIWFRRLIAAIGYSNFGNSDESSSITIKDSLQTLKGCRGKLTKSYLDFMYNLAQAMPKSEKRRRWRSKDCHSGSMWFNVFVSRIYYDFINDPVWMSKLQEKVQRKLSTVKVPSIVDELVVSRLVVEGPGPVVDGWTEPRLDSSGVWADIDISYQGLTSITIDILINLTRKKKDISSSLPPSPQKGTLTEKERSAVYNSSVEDSGESSSEDDERIDSPQHGSAVNSSVSSRRSSSTAPSPPSVVNRITHKYFNQVAESKLVKKALEGVSSNTHISLIVEVKALVGTLVINIPPPPSNRLWYGFRPKPKLCLTARPVLGETVVSLVNISHWIEKKLYKEFEKVLVLPNMDDLVIPLMDRNIPF